MKIFFLFLLAVGSALAGEITRGPYVQLPASNDVTVVWRAQNPTLSVAYGLTKDCSEASVAAHKDGHDIVATLPSLHPGMTYYYRVEGRTFSLRTRAAAHQSFRFAVIGDFGTVSAPATAIAGLINTSDCDLLLTVGDNVYENAERKLYDPHFFKLYAPTMSRVPCFPTLGNHDIRTENGKPLLDYFYLPANGPDGLWERNYSFDYGNAHFVAIDSNPFHDKKTAEIKKIIAWVKQDLAATKQPWKLAYYHHPGHTSTGNHDETALVRDQLLPVLEAAGVQVVFNGHNHFYERLQPIHGLTGIITGASGHTLQKLKLLRPYSAKFVGDRHSYTSVAINGRQLSLQQIDAAGKTVDTFQLALPATVP